jgi:hypothetical protein
MKQLSQVYEKTPRHALYIRQHDSFQVETSPFTFYIPILPLFKDGYCIAEKHLSYPQNSKWDADSAGHYILTLNSQEMCGALMFKNEHRNVFVFVIDVQLNIPGVDVSSVSDDRGLWNYWNEK